MEKENKDEKPKKVKKVRSFSSFINDGTQHKDCTVCTRERIRLVTTQVVNEKTGIIGSRSEMRKINRHEEMKNYRVSDFSLTNLMAIGASLNPAGSFVGNRFDTIANIEKQISKLEKK